jgi:hypothetical protein
MHVKLQVWMIDGTYILHYVNWSHHDHLVQPVTLTMRVAHKTVRRSGDSHHNSSSNPIGLRALHKTLHSRFFIGPEV